MTSRRRHSRIQITAAECLEDKALLSATLSEGVLTLEGTPENDVMRVSVHPEDETIVVAKVNDETFEFARADIESVRATGGDGADFIGVGKRVAVPAELDGGEGPDRLIGSVKNDILIGGGGRDKITGGRGSDIIRGGDANDKMNGGSGADTMFGGAGHDRMFGHFGADLMFGGIGNDFMSGSRGDDVMDGGAGNDGMDGGLGDDDMAGGEGNDRMFAGPGSDLLFGGVGDDTLTGNSNDDILNGGPGDNTINDGADRPGDGGDFDPKKRAQGIFKRSDVDKNRRLTEDEVGEERWAELIEFDADESGDISFREFFEWFKDKTGRGGDDGGDP